MSRAVAGVFVFALGFPVLAMIALAANGAFNPAVLSTFLVGGILVTFVVMVLFEIKRLVDLDGHQGEHSHSVLAGADAGPRVEDAAPMPQATATEASRGVEVIRVPEPPPTVIVVAEVREAAPIVVEPAPEPEAPIIAVPEAEGEKKNPSNESYVLSEAEPATTKKAGKTNQRTRAKAAAKPSMPQEVDPVVGTSKRRRGQSKRVVKQ